MLAYYKRERERHADMHAAKCTPAQAERAIRKLSRHFKIGLPPTVRFTSGRRCSHGSSGGILLNRDCLCWRLVAHELAHTWDIRRWMKARALGTAKPVRRWHSKAHARLVDRLIRYIKRKGWHLEPSAQQVLATLKPAPGVDVALSALRQQKIDRRRAQVLRLERKIKGLQTRLKRARRSLAALERAQARQQQVQVQDNAQSNEAQT